MRVGICAITLLFAAGAGLAQRDTPVTMAATGYETDRARAIALLAALEAYECSIESLHWEQTSFTPPSTVQERRTWLKLEESERFVNAVGWWMHRSRFVQVDPTNDKVSYDNHLYFGDGSHRVAVGIDEQQGMLTDADDFFMAGCNIWRVMGRSVDYSDVVRARPLATVLSAAQRVEYMVPSDNEPWPGIRCRGVPRSHLSVCVRLDPQHGFAPCVIRVLREADDLPVEAFAVLDFTNVDGLWIPHVGIQGTSYLATIENLNSPLPQGRAEDFALSASLEGLPEWLRAPELAGRLRAWIRALQDVRVWDADKKLVLGPLGCFESGEESFLASPQISITNAARVNEPILLETYFHQVPAETRLFNGFTGAHSSRELLLEFHRQLVAR